MLGKGILVNLQVIKDLFPLRKRLAATAGIGAKIGVNCFGKKRKTPVSHDRFVNFSVALGVYVDHNKHFCHTSFNSKLDTKNTTGVTCGIFV